MVAQAIVDHPGPSARLSIVDQPLAALRERSSHSTELHFGSQDLIRVAGFGRDSGFQVARFYIADSYLEPLASDEEHSLSDQFVDILEKFGSAELQSALDDEYQGLYVIGVEMISRATGFRLVVRRRGFVDTSVRDEAEALLNRAWRELMLT